jgi:hypothetical protein
VGVCGSGRKELSRTMQARERQMVGLLTDALNQLVTEAKKKAPAVKVVSLVSLRRML